MRVLTPTENKRLNELIGFLCITLAVLMGLALISYSPRDTAFNVSGAAAEDHPARNWIGPVGAYTADLLFQIFGFAAFLLPVAIGMLGWRWIRSRAVDSQWATITGYVLLLLSLPSLLSLSHFPEVRGAVPAGGLLGTVVSHGLQSGFNFWGAMLVAVATLIVALFLTTSFSFSGAHAWASSAKGPLGKMEKLGILQRAQARWHEWRDEREQKRMRHEVEERRMAGRKPVAPQIVGKAEQAEEAKTIQLQDLSDIFKGKKSADTEEEKKEKDDGAQGTDPDAGSGDRPGQGKEDRAEDCQDEYKLPAAGSAIAEVGRGHAKAG